MADQDVTFWLPNGKVKHDVSADAVIEVGHFLSVNTGAHELVAGEPWAGIAETAHDATDKLLGDERVEANLDPFEYALAGADLDNLNDPVYASDDTTLTLTAGSNTLVGIIIAVPVTGRVVVKQIPILSA